MLHQHNNLQQTTQGLVQMQSHKEGTSSLVQQESPFIQQQTKTSKEPLDEKNADMKEEVVMEMNYNEVPKYKKYVSLSLSLHITYKVEFDAFVLHINLIS